MKSSGTPTATYRLQFNRNFTFADAIGLVPFLHQLGISHVYASPLVKARAGSPHGYDIVDHNALNPEIGDEAGFNAYIEALHQHSMGLILDIVPNHMGVGGDDNSWWLDVLENGEASVYATYFDIDWHPVNPVLRNRVLLALLGDHYGKVLEQGELKLIFDAGRGSFGVRYYEHLFPIDPRNYPQILSFRIDSLRQQIGNYHEIFTEYLSLTTMCKSLPRRTQLSAACKRQRRQGISLCKRRLAELCGRRPEIHAFLQENVRRFNGSTDRPKSFDLLHRLLEAQAYRLAYWQVASDEINYRRFFDINELAGIRMDNSKVFEATHRLIRHLVGQGRVDGLRIDHLDGLSDPFSYCYELQKLINQAMSTGKQSADPPFYLLVEKILASYEHLPTDWPVAGTTGYEAAYLLNGLFIYPGTEHLLGRIYKRFTGQTVSFDELLYESKKNIMRSVLSSELAVLSNLLSAIAQSDRHTRDFTYHGLRDALGEVAACFPVYRTYITFERISDEDRRYVEWAVAQAKKRNPTSDILIFDFIHDLLVLARLAEYGSNLRRKVLQFTLRFQQYTAPLTAKGMEDTAFYIDNRLVSLNDVGFDPRTFGVSPNAFHHENKKRLADWPHAVVTTSTHDSKRGEDVRARISVLSEMTIEWRRHLNRWGRINRNKKRLCNDEQSPSRNDEYLLYQTLLGSWPLESLDASGLDSFRKRIEDYMLKAIKEAKLHTSWINPNDEYEEAMRNFVHALLDAPRRNAFLADFLPFQRRLVRFGLFNSLSQTLLKLTMPGVADIYQGNELWAFNLVDPDNRRPVDYHKSRILLQTLIDHCAASGNLPALMRELLEQIEDGRIKLYLVWKTLLLRGEHPKLFGSGNYTGLAADGPRADHICAFSRRFADKEVIVVATRWFARLTGESEALPIGDPLWDGTRIQHAEIPNVQIYRNIFTNEIVQSVQSDDGNWLNAVDLFRHLPFALLITV